MEQELASRIEQLAEVGLFQGLSSQQLQAIARVAQLRQVSSDSFFFQQGDPATHVYVLTKGQVRLSQLTTEGQQVILRINTPVETFGVLAVLGEAEYPVSAQAVEDSQALRWDRGAMNDLILQIPPLAFNIIRVLVKRIHEFQDRLREISTERVDRRIAHTLLRLAWQAGRKTEEGLLIDLPLSRQDLAEMTGTTIYTVSRTLSQWEAEGLISSGREKVVLLQPHGLVSIAEDLPNPIGF